MTYGTGLNPRETSAYLFQPDTLIPAQYLWTFRRKTQLEPEKWLILAVLEDAIECFQKYLFARNTKGKNLFRNAEEWILEENSDWVMSFDNICEVLEFDPEYVRDGLVRWKERKLAERHKSKIYRLTPRVKNNKPGLEISRTTEERLQKAASR